MYTIPFTDDAKPTNVQNPRRARLGLISQTDHMSQVQGGQQQESIPPATQSTSRKENNTTTGIVYTQSSAHPIQSQNAVDDNLTARGLKSTKNCIVIDDDSGSEPKEKFSSQPVGTQPLEVKKFAMPVSHKDRKHKLKRRSRSRANELDGEELYKEALAQQKEKELHKIQTSFQENSSNIHLSELERSGPVMQKIQR